MNYLYSYYIIINVFAFALFGADKFRAKAKDWRVPESVLLFFGFIGGALGNLLAMFVFRHKTHKLKFALLLPLFLVLQGAVALCLYKGIITF